MASAPYLTAFVSTVFGPAYGALGADPAMAATTFIAIDMGGYQLADALAQTRESWIMAMMTGYMAGATIVFTIPVALKMLEKRDRKYLALGVMSGLLAIPIGVLVASIIIALSHPVIREVVSTNAEATYQLALSFAQIGVNLVPLIIICVALALGLKFKPDAMIKGFIVFGRVMEATLKIRVRAGGYRILHGHLHHGLRLLRVRSYHRRRGGYLPSTRGVGCYRHDVVRRVSHGVPHQALSCEATRQKSAARWG